MNKKCYITYLLYYWTEHKLLFPMFIYVVGRISIRNSLCKLKVRNIVLLIFVVNGITNIIKKYFLYSQFKSIVNLQKKFKGQKCFFFVNPFIKIIFKTTFFVLEVIVDCHRKMSWKVFSNFHVYSIHYRTYDLIIFGGKAQTSRFFILNYLKKKLSPLPYKV